MFKITLPPDRAAPDLDAVAKAFGISIDDFKEGIQIGTISQWIEVGEGNEDNKPHRVFASEKFGMRVDVDERGNVHSANKYGVARAVSRSHRPEHGDAGFSNVTVAETLKVNTQGDPDTSRQTRLDTILDEALDQSFPASDPIAISFGSPQHSAPISSKSDDG